MSTVCHISTVHDWFDNRIFHRQCRSLSEAGYDVKWVVPYSHHEVKHGVEIVPLHKPKSRFTRWTISGWQALRKALATQADVYHFHDPELIPQGIVLRLLGKRVIYDIHEDYVSSVSQKHYLPKLLRNPIAQLAGLAESICSRPFTKIIAERYYEERFPDAVKVLNYPVVPPSDVPRCSRSTSRLLYTGNVHQARGALIHAAIPGFVANTTVDFIGKCAPQLHEEIVSANREHLDKISFDGIGHRVPFDTIREAYRGEWLAGLAIFPHNEHLERKELTKFFEYMLHGLPVIASHFPTWRRLVEEHECGICVDPDNFSEIRDAIERLQNDEELWNRCSRNGIACVQKEYSWSSQEQTLLDLYRKLLGTTK